MAEFKNYREIQEIISFIKTRSEEFSKSDIKTYLSEKGLSINSVEIDKLIAEFQDNGSIKSQGDMFEYIGFKK